MRRYWIQQSDKSADTVSFTGEVFHHIFSVCRQEVGSKFEVLTEESKAYLVEVTSVSKREAHAKVLEERNIQELPKPRIHIALSISRFPVMDAVMEKAVEMGVASIQPFFSDFSFVRKEEKISQNKLDRWDKIVKSATQQSGRGDLMKVLPACTLNELTQNIQKLSVNHQGFGLFAYEGPSALGIKKFLQDRRQQQLRDVSELWLIVGSEGGFSHQELERLQALDLQPVTLGAQVLRVETACIALVSALKYEFELFNFHGE